LKDRNHGCRQKQIRIKNVKCRMETKAYQQERMPGIRLANSADAVATDE
jgi:hypothetical protein